MPVELMDLTGLLDNRSDLCNNHLYSNDPALSSFLDAKQIGGDWAGCQIAPVPTIPSAGIGLLCALLAGSACWAVRRLAPAAG